MVRKDANAEGRKAEGGVSSRTHGGVDSVSRLPKTRQDAGRRRPHAFLGKRFFIVPYRQPRCPSPSPGCPHLGNLRVVQTQPQNYPCPPPASLRPPSDPTETVRHIRLDSPPSSSVTLPNTEPSVILDSRPSLPADM